jgi:hypothetical protein
LLPLSFFPLSLSLSLSLSLLSLSLPFNMILNVHFFTLLVEKHVPPCQWFGTV